MVGSIKMLASMRMTYPFKVTKMDIYITFTEKQKDRIYEWKKTLPVNKERSYGIQLHPTGDVNEDNHKLFKALMISSDGHTLFVTKRAILH